MMENTYENPRILIVGGGSVNWSPTLLRDFAVHPVLKDSDIVLYDIDIPAAERIATLAGKIKEKAQNQWNVTVATSLEAGLKGVDFVILTVGIGGLDAMAYDLEIPARYGVIQTVGDTVGPGGWARALRHIPFVEHLSKLILEISPDAWLINYTNPLTVLTRVACKLGVKCIGLCHEVIGAMPRVARSVGVDLQDLKVRVGGINHLPWALEITAKGYDAYPDLVRFYESPRFTEESSKIDYEKMNPFTDTGEVHGRILKEFGYMPLAGGRHVCEFFPYFLTEKTGYGKAFGVKPTPISYRKQQKEMVTDIVQDIINGAHSFELARSREAASDIIGTLWAGGSQEHVVNIPNQGQIDNLPREAIVECQALIERDRVIPLALGSLPPSISAVVYPHVIRQEMIVEAALERDPAKAVQALLLDPLIRDLDAGRAMADELMSVHREWLPWKR